MKIKEMTNQQIFDAVVEHAAKQYAKSEKKDTCLYRHPDGRKCFVGALIDDEDYEVTMERKGITSDEFNDLRTKDQMRVLRDLQVVHDDTSQPDKWPSALEQVGKKHRLDTSGIIPKFKEYNRC